MQDDHIRFPDIKQKPTNIRYKIHKRLKNKQQPDNKPSNRWFYPLIPNILDLTALNPKNLIICCLLPSNTKSKSRNRTFSEEIR